MKAYLEENGQISFIKPTNHDTNVRTALFLLGMGFHLKKLWKKVKRAGSKHICLFWTRHKR